MSSGVKLPDQTIVNAGQNSNVLGRSVLERMDSLTFLAPAVLAETVNIQVANKDGAVDSDFKTLQSGGADIAIAAGKAVTVTDLAAKEIRLRATVAVAADRTFGVVGAERGI
jgi:hypothetical protein